MVGVRGRLSARLFEAGATMALDRHAMCREILKHHPDWEPNRADSNVLSMMDMLSSWAIRLGALLMPAHPPQF